MPSKICQNQKVNLEMKENLVKTVSRKLITYRSNRPGVFCRKGDLRNFATFIGKHLCQISLLIRFRCSPEACNSIKKRLWHRSFPANFSAKISRNSFLYRTPLVASSSLRGMLFSW